jgi:nucleotide-binding universal stress UspA family protein
MKILIAYDGSVHADAAIDGLRRAGLPHDAEATIVCVAHKGWPAVKPENPNEEFDNSWANTLKEAEAIVEQAHRRLQAFFPGWKISNKALWGDPSKILQETAEVWRPDLLVVGSHGRSVAGRILLGSVSTDLVHHARCSVRVVRPAKEEHRGPIRILLASDGSTNSQAVLDHVLSLSWPKGTEARIVGVLQTLVPTTSASPALEAQTFATEPAFSVIEAADKQERARLSDAVRTAAERLELAGLITSSVLVEGVPQEEILKEASRWHPDTVFAGSRGLGAMSRLLLGSVSGALVKHAPCTVEIVRPSS